MKSLRPTESVNIAEVLHVTEKQLDADLIATDFVWQRWAVSIGDGLPSEAWDETPKARLPPLDDGTAIIVDRIYCKSPARMKSVLTPWYKGMGGPGTMARKLGLNNEADVYMEWRSVLRWSRTQFVESGHSDLVRMVMGGFER